MFLLATGTRRMEALTARWEHIDMESRLWYLPRAKTGARHVVLNDLALEVLRNRPRRAGSPFVFPSHRPGLPMGNPTRAWQRVLERAQIGNDSQGNPFRIHDLRHTHISYIVQLGGSLYEASKLHWLSATTASSQSIPAGVLRDSGSTWTTCRPSDVFARSLRR